MNRIGRRTIMCMLLIAALEVIWNVQLVCLALALSVLVLGWRIASIW